jgi:hypothetical protein
MSLERLPNSTQNTALRRLELCAYALQEIHTELQEPQDPESKADLLLATERVVAEVIDLYGTVRRYVWGPSAEDQDFFYSAKGEEEEE